MPFSLSRLLWVCCLLPFLSTLWYYDQWGQYSRTYCGCAANSPFIQVCVCFACAPAHAKHTQTCTTTCGRRRRPS